MVPRVFIIRHGETEWSLNGRHTGTTDIPLTANGEQRMRATGAALVGPNRLIIPDRLAHIFVSPRQRARRTLQLLQLDKHDSTTTASCGDQISLPRQVEIYDGIREWDYGDYEGLVSAEIRKLRSAKDATLPTWNIWRDGCPNGESPTDVTKRLDSLIARIRNDFHAPHMHSSATTGPVGENADVLIVAHGHILRAFAMRWIGRELEDGVSLLLDAGGVGTLSYEHENIDEPAILLGGAFVV